MPFRGLTATLTGSLRRDITLVLVLLMGLGAATTLWTLDRSVRGTLRHYVTERGELLADVLTEQVDVPLSRGDFRTVDFLVQTESEHCDYIFLDAPAYRLFASAGRVVDAPAEIAARMDTTAGTVNFGDAETLDVTAPLPLSGGRIRVGASLAPVQAARRSVLVTILWTSAIVMLVSVVGVYFMAGLITRPLAILDQAARRMGSGELEVAAPPGGHAELQSLAQTFNAMAAQIRERIAQSEAIRSYHARLLDQTPVAVLVFRGAGEVELANGSARGLQAVVHDALWSDGRAVTPRPRALTLEDGRHFDVVSADIDTIDGRKAVVVALTDVTALRSLAARLHRVERLAVAGEVSAGIVHAVNNPLDGMRRALELARRDPGNVERVSAMLDLALEGAERIAQITRTLLDLARADASTGAALVEPAELIRQAATVIGLRAEARGVRVDVEIAPNLGNVEVDPRSFTEVLVNLLVNALDAVDRGGRISIGAAPGPDGGVDFAVADDGPGVPPGLAERIFEPFFTTKEVGRGTGLGLAVARRIVAAHGGDLFLEPNPSGGVNTRVIARLPPSERTHSA